VASSGITPICILAPMEAHFFREGKIPVPCPSIHRSSIPDEAYLEYYFLERMIRKEEKKEKN